VPRRGSSAALVRKEWIARLLELDTDWAGDLALKLADLGRGIVDPALRSAGAPGRPTFSLSRQEGRILLVVLVDLYGMQARQQKARRWLHDAIENALADWHETGAEQHWPVSAAALKVLCQRVHRASVRTFDGQCYRVWQQRLARQELHRAIGRIHHTIRALQRPQKQRRAEKRK
jgi:hypothetical protein